MKLKIASYNIQSGRTNEDVSRRSYDFCLETIKEISPDIIGLNEVGRHATAGFPVLEMEKEPAQYLGDKLGMEYYFAKATEFGGHGYGNALLSKYPIKSAKTVIIPDAQRKEDDGYDAYYETRCVLVAELDILGGITVLVSHFGLMPEEKKNAVQTVLNLIKEIKTPVLLMGDLNMMADDILLSPIFRALNDASDGKKEPYTWPSNTQKIAEYEVKIKNIKGNDAGRKIDYILTSDHFKAEKIEVIQSTASDHMPYVVDFDLEG